MPFVQVPENLLELYPQGQDEDNICVVCRVAPRSHALVPCDIEFYALIVCRNCKHQNVQCVTMTMILLYAFGNKNIQLKTYFNFKYMLNYNNYILIGTYIKKSKQICFLNCMSYTCNFFVNFKEIAIVKVPQKCIKLISIICVTCVGPK